MAKRVSPEYKRELSRNARIIKSIYQKKFGKPDKDNVDKSFTGGKTMTGKDSTTIVIDPSIETIRK